MKMEKMSMRAVEVLYVSPEWVKNRGKKFNFKQYMKLIKQSHIERIQVYTKDHYGYCYYRTEIGERYPRDILGGLLEEGGKVGIEVLVYFSVQFDNKAAMAHPQWRCVDASGRPYKAGPFYFLCLNSPYRDYALSQIMEIARAYHVGGFYLDILLTTFMEYQTYACYCPYCRKIFEKTHRKSLVSSSVIEHRKKHFKIMMNASENFLEDVCRAIKEVLPDAGITYNGVGAPDVAIQHEDCVDYNQAEIHAPYYNKQGIAFRFFRSSGKPFVASVPRGYSWSTIDNKPFPLIQIETSLALAQGGGVMTSLNPWPDGSMEPEQFAGLKRLFGWVKKVEPFVQGSQPVSDIGLFLDIRRGNMPEKTPDILLEAEGFHDVLTQGHFQFDVIRTLDGCERYKVLIIPEMFISGEEAEVLRRYAGCGGRLFLSGLASLMQSGGHVRNNFLLADVLGVDFKNISDYSFTYVDIKNTRFGKRIPSLPLMVAERPVRIRLKNGAESLGCYWEPEAEDTEATSVLWSKPYPGDKEKWPLFVEQSYGRGKAFYQSVPLHRHLARMSGKGGRPALSAGWLRKLCINMMEYVVGNMKALRTNAPAGVEVVLNKLGDDYVVHLVDKYGGLTEYPSLYPDDLTLHDLWVAVRTDSPAAKAVAIPGGERLTVANVGSNAKVEIPLLKTQQIILIKAIKRKRT